jgi:DNA-binding CsgD family transcriptional regulator
MVGRVVARLSRSDLEAVLDFAGEVGIAARAPDRQDAWLLPQISRLAGVELLKYARVDPSHQSHEVTVVGHLPTTRTPEVIEALRTIDPYGEYGARTRQPHFSATRLYDIVDRKAFERTTLYQAMFLADAPAAQIRMPGHDGSTWQLEVVQPGRELTDRQLSLLDAARPWLELYEERRVLATQVAAVRAAPLDLSADSRLSAREEQVLDRVADGASNQEIAEALHISPGTVRTHLEHIYAKLEVTSRTAALARTGRTTVINGAPRAIREHRGVRPAERS